MKAPRQFRNPWEQQAVAGLVLPGLRCEQKLGAGQTRRDASVTHEGSPTTKAAGGHCSENHLGHEPWTRVRVYGKVNMLWTWMRRRLLKERTSTTSVKLSPGLVGLIVAAITRAGAGAGVQHALRFSRAFTYCSTPGLYGTDDLVECDTIRVTKHSKVR